MRSCNIPKWASSSERSGVNERRREWVGERTRVPCKRSRSCVRACSGFSADLHPQHTSSINHHRSLSLRLHATWRMQCSRGVGDYQSIKLRDGVCSAARATCSPDHRSSSIHPYETVKCCVHIKLTSSNNSQPFSSICANSNYFEIQQFISINIQIPVVRRTNFKVSNDTSVSTRYDHTNRVESFFLH